MAKQVVKPSVVSKSTKSDTVKTNSLPFVFDKTNYLLMISGVVVIIIGFILMSGGATTDKNVFPAEEIYSFRRITLAPMVVLLGFGIEIVAILKRPAQA